MPNRPFLLCYDSFYSTRHPRSPFNGRIGEGPHRLRLIPSLDISRVNITRKRRINETWYGNVGENLRQEGMFFFIAPGRIKARGNAHRIGLIKDMARVIYLRIWWIMIVLAILHVLFCVYVLFVFRIKFITKDINNCTTLE